MQVTHPVLLALSSSSRNVWSHIKVLLLCFVLVFVAIQVRIRFERDQYARVFVPGNPLETIFNVTL